MKWLALCVLVSACTGADEVKLGRYQMTASNLGSDGSCDPVEPLPVTTAVYFVLRREADGHIWRWLCEGFDSSCSAVAAGESPPLDPSSDGLSGQQASAQLMGYEAGPEVGTPPACRMLYDRETITAHGNSIEIRHTSHYFYVAHTTDSCTIDDALAFAQLPCNTLEVIDATYVGP